MRFLVAALLSSAVGLGAQASEPSLDQLLKRAGDYVSWYLEALPSVVIEEDYEQHLFRPGATRPQPLSDAGAPPDRFGTPEGVYQARRLRSDMLLIRDGGLRGWASFRDVFEMDGRRVREQDERLLALLVQAPGSAAEEARMLTRDSALLNVGDIDRALNVPTMGLMVLRAANQHRFEFRRRADDEVDGRRVSVVQFVERTRPTLLRDGIDRDVVLSGAIGLESTSGRVVRTLVRAEARRARAEMTVVFRPQGDSSPWLPAEMRDRYESQTQVIEGVARYRNYRFVRQAR